ncbi:hypothetical protein GCM10009788_28830 [Nocardioides humi]|uniref:Uncharacterized protein n=1 Tax=Nocardioides humi TaxID=449461 RepID=A0ABN2APH1_9ACTN
MSEMVAFPDLGAGLLADVAGARARVSSAADRSLGVITSDQLEDAVRRTAALRSQVDALELALAAEAERRAVADDRGDTGTEEWLGRAAPAGNGRAGSARSKVCSMCVWRASTSTCPTTSLRGLDRRNSTCRG